MKRSTWNGYAKAVAVFDVVVVLALLGVWTFGTLHTSSGYYDKVLGGSIERRLVDLWLCWGFVPAFIVTAALGFAHIDLKEDA
mgnify:CR=1 FL=1